MGRKSISAVVYLGLLSLVGILLVQYFWVQSTIEIQENDIKIQNKEDSLNSQEFTLKATQCLLEVSEKLHELQKDSVDLYGTVKKVSSNHYTVELSDIEDLFYIETLLKKAFYKKGIKEDFLIGIYDCYKDSILVSDLIVNESDSIFTYKANLPLRNELKERIPKRDGFYFSVFFPNLTLNKLTPVEFVSPWIYISIVVVLVLVFFAYSILIILRQKRLSEIKNDFINNMTHELKTPISTISLSSEMLLKNKGLNAEKISQYASIIFKENKRLEYQVEKVLNVAKLDRQKIVLEKEPFDFHEAFQDVKENFELNNADGNGQLILELHAGIHQLNVDSVHMTNVLFNLIDNACKYCQTDVRITIRSENAGSQFIFTVKDNGIGIKREHASMIFDKFYRVPTGNVHDVKGFGLGLFYVKLIVEAHGGKIEVKSAVGQGSTFKISLPI